MKVKKNGRGRPKKRGVLKKDRLRARGRRMNAFKIGVVVGRVLEAARAGEPINLAAIGRTPEVCASRPTVSLIVKRFRKGFDSGATHTGPQTAVAHTIS